MTRRPSAAAVAPLAAVFAAALVLTACQPRPEPPPEAPAAATVLAQTPTPVIEMPAPAVVPASTSAAQTPATPAPQTPATQTREPEARLPEGPKMAPRRVPLEPSGCRAEIGEAASARLVQRCIRVSPATHPPCHADNPCDMIQEEIDRGCAMWTETEQPMPKECAA